MQTIVGVLRGGPSREHEISIQTGSSIMKHLAPERYLARDIYIDRSGVWHERGRATSPDRILQQVDVVLNGMHGEYGEDGQVQRVLERFGVPFAGSDSFGSYLAMHKGLAKMRLHQAGIRTPNFFLIESAGAAAPGAREVMRRFMQPVVVKPVGWGSSVGVRLVGGHLHVLNAIESLFQEGASAVLVEEYIRGKEATVGVVDNLRGEKLYSLPAIEIAPPAGDFFSYDAKYSGLSREICPGNFSRTISEELRRAAKVAHRTLGLRHYSRSDFIVAPRGVYYLETNTLPGLTEESLLPKALATVGVSMPDFLHHLVNLAKSR